MKIVPMNFADTLRGSGHLPPVLAVLAPDLRRLYDEPAAETAAVPAEIAALLARLAADEDAAA
jgi:hypothetical protein